MWYRMMHLGSLSKVIFLARFITELLLHTKLVLSENWTRKKTENIDQKSSTIYYAPSNSVGIFVKNRFI